MIFRSSVFLMMMLGLLVTGNTGCSSGDVQELIYPVGPDTAVEYTTRGWSSFEAGNLTAALADFNSALGLNAQYGQAMAGQGWCSLKVADSVQGINQAKAQFIQARNTGLNDGTVLAGLAACQLAAGGADLALAYANAGTLLTSNPSFVFEHQASFDFRDLRLIRAMAQMVAGNFGSAQIEADLIQASNITSTNPATWIIAGITYPNYPAAVAAHLHLVSEQYSG